MNLFKIKPHMKKIDISTALCETLDITISNNIVDSFFKGGADKENERDMEMDPYFSLTELLKFGDFTVMVDGQTARYAHPKIDGGVGSGYNGKKDDFASNPDNTYEGYGGGVLSKKWKSDFFLKAKSFLNKLGCSVTIVANPENGSIEELLWLLNNFHVKQIIYGAECATYLEYDANKVLRFSNGKKYDDVVNEWMAQVWAEGFRGRQILCGGLLYRGNNKSRDLNNTVAAMSADAVVQYLQVSDRVPLTDSPSANIAALISYFGATTADDVCDFMDMFPNKKLWYGEINLKDNDGTTDYINNTLLGTWSLARIAQNMVKYGYVVAGGAWMSHKNLIDSNDLVKENYFAWKTLNTFLNNAKVRTRATLQNISGVEVESVMNGNHHYILITNTTGARIDVDQITVNGKKVKNFNQKSRSGTAWDGGVTMAEFEGASYPYIDGMGVTLIDFVV